MSSSRLLNGSNQYLEYAGAVLSSYPISISAWFKTDDVTIDETIVSISDASEGQVFHRMRISGAEAEDYISAFTRDTGVGIATTTLGVTVNTWHHGCAVFAAGNDRRIFLDGGNKGTDNVDLTPANLDKTIIGAMEHSGVNQHFSGNIALVIIRNIALSDADVALEAAASDPSSIQSASIVAYWFNGTEVDTDHEASFDMTPVNSPMWDSGDFPIAPPAVGNRIPIIDHHNRMMVMMGD